MDPFLLCFGLGFAAWPFARRMQGLGWRVVGTSRTVEKAGQLGAHGVDCLVFSEEQDLPSDLLEHATHCLISIPPGREGDPGLRRYEGTLERIRPQWVGYLSSTGVYGDYGGAWVDETSACHPSQERSRWRLEAEKAWFAFGQTHRISVDIFRLAGIYGPGRNMLDTLRSGRAHRIIKPGQVFSRIHVDDIAAVLEAACAHPRGQRVFNVCDDDPAAPQDVLAYAAALLNVPLPEAAPFDSAQLSPMARSFYADNKRVSNRKMKEQLGVRLRYENYREGLAALLHPSAPASDYFPTDLLKK